MRLAIISDIHANFVALEAVLEKIEDEGADAIICLGDVVGYGAQPQECVEAVREKALVSLLGNHDAAVTGVMELYYYRQSAAKVILKTRQMLSKDAYEWLYSMPYSYEMNIARFYHGAPINPSNFFYVVKVDEAKAHSKVFDKLAPITFIGHSHMPNIFKITKRHAKIVDEEFLSPSEKVKYIVNVGSVGQPRDRDPRAAFLIWDTDNNMVRHVRVEYNIKAAAELILKAGFEKVFAQRLFSGT